MSESERRFKTVDEREGSWSTNALQLYQVHRDRAFGHLEMAKQHFDHHNDFRAFEEIAKLNEAVAGMKRAEAYSDETGNLLLQLADRLEGMQRGIAYTEAEGRDIIAEAREAGMGKMR